MNTRSTKAVALLVLILALVLSVMPSMAQYIVDDAPTLDGEFAPDADNIVRMLDGRVQYTVKLSQPAAVDAFLASRGLADADAVAAAQMETVAFEQANFEVAAANALGADVITRSRYLVNTVTVAVQPDQVDALWSLPGVIDVAPNVVMVKHDTTSTTAINVPEVWEGGAWGAAVTGDNVVVAIIDSGIDYTHAHFGGDEDFAAAFATNTVLDGDEFGDYPIATVGDPKVVGGYDWVGDAFTGSETPVEDPDPLDCRIDDGGGHGTHVAGSTAGWGVTDAGATYTTRPLDTTTFDAAPDPDFLIGPGVAPDAALLAMRVFGCDGSTTSALVTTAIDASVAGSYTPDGGTAVTFPKANVINMSLGSAFGSASDPFYGEAIKAAMDADVLVVASAGNSGDTYFITGRPSSVNEALSVSSIADGYDMARVADVTTDTDGNFTTPVFYGGTFGPFTHPVTTWDTGASPENEGFVRPDGTTDDTTQLGCDAAEWAADLDGAIVLIDRGVCAFTTKLTNAFAANAGGVIMVSDSRAPGGMGGDPIPGYDLISVMVSNEDGGLIKAALAADETISFVLDNSVTEDTGDEVANTPSSFTSRGPVRGTMPNMGIKPDVGSIGNTVVSAGSGTGDGPYNISGTSMAAPHVAGQAALFYEFYGTFDTDALTLDAPYTAYTAKARIMNSALTDIDDGDGTLYSPQRVGSGLADAVAMLDTEVQAFNKDNTAGVSVRFPHQQLPITAPAIPAATTQTITLQNFGGVAITYDIAVLGRSDVPGTDGNEVEFTAPETVTVPAATGTDPVVPGTADVTVTLSGTLDVDAARSTGFPSDPTRSFFDPLILEESAIIEFTDQGTTVAPSRVPVYASFSVRTEVAAADTFTAFGLEGAANVAATGTGYDSWLDFGDPFGLIALTTPFELSYEAETPEMGLGELEAVGFTSDGATAYFALAMDGAYSALQDLWINVSIDVDEDGTVDWIVYNTYSNGDYATAVFDLNNAFGFGPGAGVIFGDIVNDVSGTLIDTYVYHNNVVVLPISMDVMEAFAPFDDGDGKFAFYVEVFDGDDDSETPVPLSASADPADAATWQSANYKAPVYYYPGVYTGGAGMGVNLVGEVDTESTINFNYNFAAFNTAGEGQTPVIDTASVPPVMLVHHHNTLATTWEKATLDADNSDFSPQLVFNLLSPADGTFSRTALPSALEITFEPSAAANSYTWTLLQISNNVRIAEIASLPLPTSICESDVCTFAPNDYSIDPATLGTGEYAWTITANTFDGEIEAANGPFFFQVALESFELIAPDDQGFEGLKEAGLTPKDLDGINSGWDASASLSKMAIKCNKYEDDGTTLKRNFSYAGECALLIKNNGTGNLRYNLPADRFADGDEITVSFYVENTKITDAKNKNITKMIFRFKDADGNNLKGAANKVVQKIKPGVFVPGSGDTPKFGAAENYSLVTETVEFDVPSEAVGGASKSFFQFLTPQNAAKVLVDEVSIVTGPGENAAPELAEIGAQTIAEGAELTFTATATDADGDTLTYSLESITAPAGFAGTPSLTETAIDASTGAFAWTPAAGEAGEWTVDVVVSDGVDTDSETVTITVSTPLQEIPSFRD